MDEQQKFDSLRNAFEKVIDKLLSQVGKCKDNKNKCTGFFNWLSKDTQKQKELANAFTTAYNFLEDKKQKKQVIRLLILI
ncbi:Mlp family lipoprotein (plasmid) [Borrelia hermsii]|uniref:Mlp family lipoprotein n=1 Tax=Borrelia hermsii TaxID=140 RepID=UPI001F5198D8|nr:Mlp family lipoprotein [Borrelia hermsii]